MLGFNRVLVIAAAMACTVSAESLEPAASQAGTRHRIAVLTFKGASGPFQHDIGGPAASALTVELVNRRAFTVIEREKLLDILAEQRLPLEGFVTPQQAAQVGKLMGVQYLITGELTEFAISNRTIGPYFEQRATTALNVRMIDTVTSEVVIAAETRETVSLGRGVGGRLPGTAFQIPDVRDTEQRPEFNPTAANRALQPVVKKLVDQLVEKVSALPEPDMPVPEIVGNPSTGVFYINLGANAGITPGQRFEVHRVTNVIKDKDGSVLDRVTERIGLLEVTRVMDKSSVCKVVEGKPTAKGILRPVER